MKKFLTSRHANTILLVGCVLLYFYWFDRLYWWVIRGDLWGSLMPTAMLIVNTHTLTNGLQSRRLIKMIEERGRRRR